MYFTFIEINLLSVPNFMYICVFISQLCIKFDVVDEMGPSGMGQSSSSYMMGNGYEMDVYGDAPDKMTYTEQANKRSHCRRLTRYELRKHGWSIL